MSNDLQELIANIYIGEEQMIQRIIEQCNRETFIKNYYHLKGLSTEKVAGLAHFKLPGGLNVYIENGGPEEKIEEADDIEAIYPYRDSKRDMAKRGEKDEKDGYYVYIVPSEVEEEKLRNSSVEEAMLKDQASIRYFYYKLSEELYSGMIKYYIWDRNVATIYKRCDKYGYLTMKYKTSFNNTFYDIGYFHNMSDLIKNVLEHISPEDIPNRFKNFTPDPKKAFQELDEKIKLFRAERSPKDGLTENDLGER